MPKVPQARPETPRHFASVLIIIVIVILICFGQRLRLRTSLRLRLGNRRVSGSVLIWRGARIVLNPQRLDGADMLRVGTTRAPLASLKFELGHNRRSWLTAAGHLF